MKKWDKIFLSAALILAVALFFGYRVFGGPTGNYCEITVDGKVIGTYQMLEDMDVPIDVIPETSIIDNVVHIGYEEVYMSFANCPDKTCVRQGKISRVNSQIVCLPHKVIVRILSDDEIPEADVVAK